MEEDKFKIIFTKLQKINPVINEITIGPNAVCNNNIKGTSPTKSIGKNPEKKVIINYEGDFDIVNKIPTREYFKVLDLQRQDKLQSALNSRLSVFEQFDRAQKEHSKDILLKIKQDLVKEVERKESIILEASKQFDMKMSTQQTLMAQQTQHNLSRIREKQEQLREREKQRRKLIEIIDQIKLNQYKFSTEWQEVINDIKGCENINNILVKNVGKIDLNILQTLPLEMASIIEKCNVQSGNVMNISNEDVQKSENIVAKIVEFKNSLKVILKEEAQLKAETQPKDKIDSAHNQDNLQVTAQEKLQTGQPVLSAEVVNENVSYNKLSRYVGLNDLQLYAEVIEFLEKYRQTFAELENDTSLKMFRFDLKKAVNIPVNSLSGVNSEHIIDKYQKLYRLLLGQSVIISDKEVNAARHPQGVAFCLDLLAKKLVLQGDLMVSANPESAFCYASIILSLWNDFPVFGKLLMGYFYKFCPYTLPYYIPRQVGESDEEFYTKLGYQYTEGEVEKQDKFLKRMTGILKLYFTILISKPKRGQATSPHNLQNGWKWLASFLRLEPQIDITATALHVFLETVGFEMENKYGRMFQKVLKVIIQQFLPKCQKIQCSGGAVIRLELLLTEYLKTNKFVKPNGYSEYAMW